MKNRSRHREPGGDEVTAIRVTHHAVQRFCTRARTSVDHERIAVDIRRQILAALHGAMIHVAADRTTYLVPLSVRGGRPLCAVLAVAGPVEKPFAVTVCTVLSEEMAARSYGHVAGLLSAMDEKAIARVAA
jgi:hypothetical protein